MKPTYVTDKDWREWMVGSLFADLTAIADQTREGDTPGYGHPMSYVLDQALRWPQSYKELVSRIASAEESGELRLNGAGLKLYFNSPCEDSPRLPEIVIAGDQAKQYPAFVAAARGRLKKLGFTG